MQVIFILFAVIASAFATDYGYINNNLVELEDAPLTGIGSLNYPYQEPHRFVAVDKRPFFYNNVYNPVAVPKVAAIVDTAAKISSAAAAPIVPAIKAITVSKANIITTIVSVAFSWIKSAVTFIFFNAPALITGCLSVLGICKVSPVCGIFSKFNSLSEVQTELTSFVTPERVRRATDFVRQAIRKYRSIQDN